MKALLIVDLQNDFAKPGGALYFPGAENVIPNIVKIVEEFKAQNLPIIYTKDWHEDNDYEFSIWGVHCLHDTHGSEIVDELKKALEDYQNKYEIKKSRYSGFYGTNLDELLKKLGVTEVHVGGLVTHICVLFTVEELRNRGIETIVHSNCVDSFDKSMHEFALREMKEVLLAKVI
ncbi:MULTISPECIES: cysteine hydrolase family protein [Fervidobacterium]|uniref:Isochorismatase hydrolase n=1 Tax=Fervidobacterium nodosum (strain ATCC 35602 / DSM 5306 / Rt17-B1) TaxID=381764 RepID=A7HKQ9_FERNB|nr:MULTISPECIES: isochorismatase family cysteine hydrolase [Fervidobacterium]ABS60492.1 isochorismatase hydrolase [Fervidobacterium nodosum Rt17-B1]KAF2962543.1 cysteine hydrolase [Fervidobacterium sp. 2310opik-2]PHJ14457.1 cysteine hydrolase [Fervidobacterium sp. SC_NGM5_G05]